MGLLRYTPREQMANPEAAHQNPLPKDDPKCNCITGLSSIPVSKPDSERFTLTSIPV
jgi:hypothetical protein